MLLTANNIFMQKILLYLIAVFINLMYKILDLQTKFHAPCVVRFSSVHLPTFTCLTPTFHCLSPSVRKQNKSFVRPTMDMYVVL